MFFIGTLVYLRLLFVAGASLKDYEFLDICGLHNSRKLYVEYGTSGVLTADYRNRRRDFDNREQDVQRNCSIEFITCPSCIIEVRFKYLNISRTCGKTTVFSHCGCDYILLHEHPFEESSGEQFCGRFIENNVSNLSYLSRTRFTIVEFIFTQNYGHAFTLEFSAKRNRIIFEGYPSVGHMNNASQIITTPYFPHLYPSDLSAEYVIRCNSKEHCRISLLFTDFLMAEASILEFFDYNGQRMHVISGNIFRPPVIVTSGPSLVLRFYANGASDFGFKAYYSFILGNLDDATFKPDIGCGGQVNNLGGGITMMNMLKDGTKFFDCVWIVKPPMSFLHRKTHLYVKVVNFSNFDGSFSGSGHFSAFKPTIRQTFNIFHYHGETSTPDPCGYMWRAVVESYEIIAGTTELILRQGLTSNEPSVEVLKYPLSHFNSAKEKEHIAPIDQGFYISLQGLFKPESHIAIVYAAFNYKDCYSGLDFLCHNLRCISTLLNCDGFDHCGDNSDESLECSEDPKDRREISKIPNFLFPKKQPYADLTTATFIFLICTFGLIGIIFAMALLLYRVNMRERHQRQIQDHIETIHAILGEGVGDLEEEIIVPDEPPEYEHPPEYSDVLKYLRKVACSKSKPKPVQTSSKPIQSTSNYSLTTSSRTLSPLNIGESALSTNKSCQTSPLRVPASPPPSYENLQMNNAVQMGFDEYLARNNENVAGCSRSFEGFIRESPENSPRIAENMFENRLSNFSRNVYGGLGTSMTENIRRYRTSVFSISLRKKWSFSDENLIRYFSDSELLFSSRVNCPNEMKRSYSIDNILTL